MTKFTIEIEKGEELWLADCDYLNVYTTGGDVLEALHLMMVEVACEYKKFKTRNDDILGPYAIELKQRLKKVMENA